MKIIDEVKGIFKDIPLVKQSHHVIALTGASGSGKTTLLGELSKRGYEVVPEAAQDIIEEEMRIKSDVLPWYDAVEFQRHVIELQLKRESMIREETTFVDRGIPDSIAYLQFNEIEIFPDLYDIGRNRYAAVFLLEPITGFNRDVSQLNATNTVNIIQKLIEQAYVSLSYHVQHIPVMSVEERAEKVISFIKELLPVQSAHDE